MQLKKVKKILWIITSLSLIFQIFIPLALSEEQSQESYTYDISHGDIRIERGTGDTLMVTYGIGQTVEDEIAKDTMLTLVGRSCVNAVTITGVTANITFHNLEIIGENTVDILGNSNVNLTLSGENVLKNTNTKTGKDVGFGLGAGLGVNQASELTIAGTDRDKLIAIGANRAAGIGGGNGLSGGTIRITGGNIEATCGGSYGAGIGGGYNGSGGAVIIDGGTVTATGGQPLDKMGGAGIGGGYKGSGELVIIRGGTVKAKGGLHGAGIGGGWNGLGGKINIEGGKVEAIGGINAAGIGSGNRGVGGEVNISGGEVKVTGGYNGAGIGGGHEGSGGSVIIGGGIVTASGGSGGFGIGGGYNGSGGEFTANGGNAFIIASNIQDKAYKTDPATQGIIFDGRDGVAYGSPHITCDITIPTGYSLTVKSGTRITVSGGAILTNNGAIKNYGSLIMDANSLKGNLNIEGEGLFVSLDAISVSLSSYTYTGDIIIATIKNENTNIPGEDSNQSIDNESISFKKKMKNGNWSSVINIIDAGTYRIVLKEDTDIILEEVIIAKAEQDRFNIVEVTGKKFGDMDFILETIGGSGEGLVIYSVSENNGVLSINGNIATIIGTGSVEIRAIKSADDNYNKSIASLPLKVTNLGPTDDEDYNLPNPLPAPLPEMREIWNLPKETRISIIGERAKVDISEETITSAIKKAKLEAKKSPRQEDGLMVEINIYIKDEGVKNLSLKLVKKSIDDLVEEKIKELRINSDILKINLDLETLKAIQEDLATDANISMVKLDKTRLSEEVKVFVGDHPIFEFTITGRDGRILREFRNGRISISLPYSLGENEKKENLMIYHMDSNNNVKEILNSFYDEERKTISFTTGHFSKFIIGYKEDIKIEPMTINFIDIENHWAQDDIEFVASRGLFSGTGDDKFSPNMDVTRGMFVTVLGRLANADINNYKESEFIDVERDVYYMSYIEWANQIGIVGGTGNKEFGPNQSITREQMAVIISNYLRVINFQLPETYKEKSFVDKETISNYAKTAVKEMQIAGLISGKEDDKFDPKGGATRAEVSAVLRRFIELVEKQNKLEI